MKIKKWLLGAFIGYIAYISLSVLQDYYFSQGEFELNLLPHLIRGLIFIVILTISLFFWTRWKTKK